MYKLKKYIPLIDSSLTLRMTGGSAQNDDKQSVRNDACVRNDGGA